MNTLMLWGEPYRTNVVWCFVAQNQPTVSSVAPVTVTVGNIPTVVVVTYNRNMEKGSGTGSISSYDGSQSGSLPVLDGAVSVAVSVVSPEPFARV